MALLTFPMITATAAVIKICAKPSSATSNKLCSAFFYKELNSLSYTVSEKCPYSKFFWYKCEKMRTRKTPNTDTSHAVTFSEFQSK